MIDVSLSIDMGYIAARAAILAVHGLIVLAGAGADALDRTFDEAFRDEPVLGSPSPNDSDGSPAGWSAVLPSTFSRPTPAGNLSARSAR